MMSVYFSQLRKRSFEVLEDEPSSDSNPEREAVVAEQRNRLLSALGRLPIQTRQVVSLALEGLTYAEISEIVGITQTNVGVVLNRGKLRLNQMLGGSDG